MCKIYCGVKINIIMLVTSPCGWANGLQNALSPKKQKQKKATALLRSSDHIIQVGGAMLEFYYTKFGPLMCPIVFAVCINASN